MQGCGRFKDLFAAIDTSDVDAFMRWLSDDCTFVYGSGEPVRGGEAVRAMVAGFLAGFERLEHRIDAHWEVDGSAIMEGTVTYHTSDGNATTVPFCNVLHLAEDGRVRDYRVYIDPSPLG